MKNCTPVKGLQRFLTKRGKLLEKNLFVLPSGDIVKWLGNDCIEVTTDGIHWKILGVSIGPLWLKDNVVYLETPYHSFVHLFRVN